uniref:Uncharacterized protein n=1 Tax=Tanacetum cinerariifolium TaxID=118510 RepID=A0A6L2MMQ3_TANCI|nr:hypothetical protein [Tanacetum cinerariifolium]
MGVKIVVDRHKWFWPGFFVARQVCGGTDRISGHGATDYRKDFILTILKKESRYGRGIREHDWRDEGNSNEQLKH